MPITNTKDESKKSTSSVEKRSFEVGLTIETREEGDTKPAKMIGHAAIFNEYVRINTFFDSFEERIMPGAFTDTMNTDDVRALFNHDPNYVLGRNKSGTLAMREDKVGLAINIDPPDTQFARDLSHLIDRGDVSQMSFAFQVLEDKWMHSDDDDTPDKRDIIKVKLYDISPVTYPAYEGTDIALARRSMALNNKDDKRSFSTDNLRRGLEILKEGGK